ncbi:methyl-accepting chemotaxis protein [Halalkalibacterium ligniniphilum]|uniref:methyl-accepting chemotaxis protein n=1 Tax=Halalkalibacterium ligniniphilum TaxID=1134413 RepID=UPI000367EF6D|nr:methyl-accepting chemotaxis protein [Halalkalibacterium ligniniphilum]
MGRNNVLNQFIIKIGATILIVLIITVAVAYYVIRSEVHTYQTELINSMKQIVVQAMDNSYSTNQTIEHLIDIKLLTASKAIARALEGKQIDEITVEELNVLKEQWDLYDISLFTREGDDIVVTKTTDPNELGLSSKDWGYWFTAFNQLMNGQEVTVEKGYADGNYWVGPISRSEWEDKYYKYAYYYMEDSDILLNPYVIDEEIYRLTYKLGTNAIIEETLNENPDFEEIAVINVPAWLKGDENDVVEPEFDLPVLYGSHTITYERDAEFFENVLETGEKQSIYFTSGKQEVKKTYIPLENNRVMTIVSNLDRIESIEQKMAAIIVISFLVIFSVLIYMIRLIAKKQLKPLEILTSHIKDLSTGDFTKKIILAEKNEWGFLAENMNEMTELIHDLIAEVKKEVHSLHYVSGMLATQSNDSLEKMKDVSMKMTDESKLFLVELNGKLESFVGKMNQSLKDSKIEKQELQKVDEHFATIQKDLHSFLHFSQEHAYNISDLSIMLIHTINELTEAITHLDNLSEKLKEKIEVFKVH